mmetsp:Transcript_14584/g.45082  ORF Transcript_14584/g.45082 Transcript_14584/m.45082 type:complete len:241 (+) Transcript_14584:375-1097(+)
MSPSPAAGSPASRAACRTRGWRPCCPRCWAHRWSSWARPRPGARAPAARAASTSRWRATARLCGCRVPLHLGRRRLGSLSLPWRCAAATPAQCWCSRSWVRGPPRPAAPSGAAARRGTGCRTWAHCEWARAGARRACTSWAPWASCPRSRQGTSRPSPTGRRRRSWSTRSSGSSRSRRSGAARAARCCASAARWRPTPWSRGSARPRGSGARASGAWRSRPPACPWGAAPSTCAAAPVAA